MSVRDIRIKMESLGNTLVKMKAVFTSEKVVDEWNRRKIIPLALAYQVVLADGQTAIIESMCDNGYRFRVTIGAVTVDCNFIRQWYGNSLVLLGDDNRIYATIEVMIRK